MGVACELHLMGPDLVSILRHSTSTMEPSSSTLGPIELGPSTWKLTFCCAVVWACSRFVQLQFHCVWSTSMLRKLFGIHLDSLGESWRMGSHITSAVWPG